MIKKIGLVDTSNQHSCILYKSSLFVETIACFVPFFLDSGPNDTASGMNYAD